jgi:predicted nucleotidyltransferase component of viral defense system
MHEAVRNMMARYECRTRDDTVGAVREILQDLALLGLWRSKFFERAAFYGGSSLRILHGLDRYSEDLDFSLLKPDPTFSLGPYGDALRREMSSFGFHVDFETRPRMAPHAIESAFLKANTYTQLIVVGVDESALRDLHPLKVLKIKLEVDVDPPGGFETETPYVLQPVPFAVRAYRLPDLCAGKLHAVLCRRWKTRVKGRDWYDLVWYASYHPKFRIRHLEARMRQSGDYREDAKLTPEALQSLLLRTLENLDIEKARQEVAPFVRDRHATDVWSQDFFRDIFTRIIAI